MAEALIGTGEHHDQHYQLALRKGKKGVEYHALFELHYASVLSSCCFVVDIPTFKEKASTELSAKLRYYWRVWLTKNVISFTETRGQFPASAMQLLRLILCCILVLAAAAVRFALHGCR